MPPPPNFGKRGVPGVPVAPPRRWRSQTVIVGAVGAIALGGVAASEWRDRRCEPHGAETAEPHPAAGDGPRPAASPEPRPAWCDSRSGGHRGGGHGWGFGSGGGGGGSHASFGGFGSHGSGHGGG